MLTSKLPSLTGSAQSCLVALLLFGASLAQAHIVDPAGYVHPDVVEICHIMAAAHDTPLVAQPGQYSALSSLDHFAASHLRRPAGVERLDEAAKAFYAQLLAPVTPEQRQQLVALLNASNGGYEAAPAHTAYDYIFIHGSTVPNMRSRIHALATSVLQKKFDIGPGTQVIFFDGERPLFAKETLEVLLNPHPYLPDPTFTPPAEQPRDERPAAEMVYRQLWLPTALRDAPVSFVHAPAEPGMRRAHTQGVVRYWLETARPRSGRALMVSSNPYVEYQRLATLLALREAQGPAIDITAMGPEEGLEADGGDVALGVRLDNLAASLSLARKLRDLGDAELQSALLP